MSVAELNWNDCREISLPGACPKRNAILFGGFSVSARALSRLGQMMNEKWKAGVRMTSLSRHNCDLNAFLRSRGWHYAIEGRREFFSFCAHAEGPVIAGGNSTGALVALIAAALHPGRIAGVIAVSPAIMLRGAEKSLLSALVLGSYYLLPAAAIAVSSVRLRKELRRGNWRSGLMRHLLFVVSSVAVQQALKRSSFSLQRSLPYLEEGLEVMHPRHDKACIVTAASLLPLQLAVLVLLPFVKAPVCIIAGDDDEVINFRGLRLASGLIEKCELHILPGGRHRLLSDPHCAQVVEIADRFCGRVWSEMQDAA